MLSTITPPYHANPGKRVFNSMQKKLWIILRKILQQHYVFQSTADYLIEAYTHSFIRFGPVCHLYYCNIYFACCSQFFQLFFLYNDTLFYYFLNFIYMFTWTLLLYKRVLIFVFFCKSHTLSYIHYINCLI